MQISPLKKHDGVPLKRCEGRMCGGVAEWLCSWRAKPHKIKAAYQMVPTSIHLCDHCKRRWVDQRLAAGDSWQ